MASEPVLETADPATLRFAERIRPNQETWDRIRLDDYIDR